MRRQCRPPGRGASRATVRRRRGRSVVDDDDDFGGGRMTRARARGIGAAAARRTPWRRCHPLGAKGHRSCLRCRSRVEARPPLPPLMFALLRRREGDSFDCARGGENTKNQSGGGAGSARVGNDLPAVSRNHPSAHCRARMGECQRKDNSPTAATRMMTGSVADRGRRRRRRRRRRQKEEGDNNGGVGNRHGVAARLRRSSPLRSALGDDWMGASSFLRPLPPPARLSRLVSMLSFIIRPTRPPSPLQHRRHDGSERTVEGGDRGGRTTCQPVKRRTCSIAHCFIVS